MDPRAFQEFAESAVLGGRAVDCRNAISRAYYAALKMARAGQVIALFLLFPLPLRAADFTVLDEYAGPPLVGFGAQLNGWIYCKPNWGEVNETNVKDLEQKLIDLAPQHVRIFVQTQPLSTQQSKPDVNESVMRVIALAQRAGATINLTVWHGPYINLRDSADRIVRFLIDVIRNRKLTAVQYVTIQNEPNSFDMNKQKYIALYREFDQSLRRAGLRDQIKIVGGDLLSDNEEAWFRALADNLNDVLDGYSVHMYSDYWDEEHIVERVTQVPPIIRTLPEQARKPVYITEFGFRGYRKGKEEPGTYEGGVPLYETNLQPVLAAWLMMKALNRGYVAAVQWDAVDVMYDRSHMYYGLIGEPAKGFPLKPGYHLMYLFTHTTKPGWRALKIWGGRVPLLVAATNGPRNAMTVYALNRGAQAHPLSIGGLAADTVFKQQVWNADGKGKLTDADAVKTSDKGVATLNMAPMSVVALTKDGQ